MACWIRTKSETASLVSFTHAKRFVHCGCKLCTNTVDQVYGGEIAGEFLSALGRLFTHHLKYNAQTLGVADLVVKGHADEV